MEVSGIALRNREGTVHRVH